MRSTVRFALAAATALSLTAPPALAGEAPRTVLKLGTLAPANSSWMAAFRRAARETTERTGGQVVFKLFGGGRQGDEKVMVGKMRTGQLHAVGVTAVGLGEIAPEILILQTPGLIRTYRDLDAVRTKLQPRFDAALAAKGFTLAGWGDVGLYYYYSARRAAAPEDIAGHTVWAWTEDPISRAMATALGGKSTPRGVPGVLPALTNGKIDALYTASLVCVQLQWCNHMKFRLKYPIATGIGGIVFSEAALSKLTPEHRAIVMEVWGKWAGKLVGKVRKDNTKASKLLVDKKGFVDVEPDAAAKAKWEALYKKVQDDLADRVYPKALLDEVRGIVGGK